MVKNIATFEQGHDGYGPVEDLKEFHAAPVHR